MFDPILVPLDGSLLAECVLPYASALAQAFGAKVKLLRVVDKGQEAGKSQLFDLVNWQINKTGAKLYLDKVSAKLLKSGLKVELIVQEGLVAEFDHRIFQNTWDQPDYSQQSWTQWVKPVGHQRCDPEDHLQRAHFGPHHPGTYAGRK